MIGDKIAEFVECDYDDLSEVAKLILVIIEDGITFHDIYSLCLIYADVVDDDRYADYDDISEALDTWRDKAVLTMRLNAYILTEYGVALRAYVMEQEDWQTAEDVLLAVRDLSQTRLASLARALSTRDSMGILRRIAPISWFPEDREAYLDMLRKGEVIRPCHCTLAKPFPMEEKP